MSLFGNIGAELGRYGGNALQKAISNINVCNWFRTGNVLIRQEFSNADSNMYKIPLFYATSDYVMTSAKINTFWSGGLPNVNYTTLLPVAPYYDGNVPVLIEAAFIKWDSTSSMGELKWDLLPVVLTTPNTTNSLDYPMWHGTKGNQLHGFQRRFYGTKDTFEFNCGWKNSGYPGPVVLGQNEDLWIIVKLALKFDSPGTGKTSIPVQGASLLPTGSYGDITSSNTLPLAYLSGTFSWASQETQSTVQNVEPSVMY